MNVLFLYTELANYTLNCIDKISHILASVHVVHYKVNNEAPFNFKFNKHFNFYQKEKLPKEQLIELVEEINPDVIFCSGWTDKEYLSICKNYKDRIPVILGFDNQWKGTVRQHAASMLSDFIIHKYFNVAWVPGEIQKKFALKLGFSDKEIYKNFYSCDFNYYDSVYKKFKSLKENHFPKRFIFVGRYYDFKGVEDLWSAFVKFSDNGYTDWELWCLGKGDVEPVLHPKIKHFGFVQPSDMESYFKNTGVFILPSRFEPWGVAVHEFASAGFPLLVSDEVGAKESFVKNEKNGFIFKSGNVESLYSSLVKIACLSESKLNEMGKRSNAYASEVTPDTWARTLEKLIKDYYNNNVRN